MRACNANFSVRREPTSSSKRRISSLIRFRLRYIYRKISLQRFYDKEKKKKKHFRNLITALVIPKIDVNSLIGRIVNWINSNY